MQTKTKTIAMFLLIAIATVGAIGIVGTGIQSAQARFGFDPDDSGHGQSFHDANGDLHSNGHG
jgi:cation transporter-like permease